MAGLIRLTTIGSVDDGKSTLIGRLLHDTDQLLADQLSALTTASRRRGVRGVDLSFATDGLRAEREQGITIDVAYRYAKTPNRRLVIADCPGHLRYTRNMATGSSTADLALVLVDSTKGLRDQTRRHCAIASLLGVSSMIFALNKLDLMGWDEEVFEEISAEVRRLATRLGLISPVVIPMSALHGDNVAERSANTPYYGGPTLVEALDRATPRSWATSGSSGMRFPVQWVIRHPGGGRSYGGMVAGGTLREGDEVVVQPSGEQTVVRSVSTFDGRLPEASAPLSVNLEVFDDIDIGRGDMIAAASDPPSLTSSLHATVCWFSDAPLSTSSRYLVKHTTRTVGASVLEVLDRLDFSTLAKSASGELVSNDVGSVRFELHQPLSVDPYSENHHTGSFVIIDPATNATVGAGLVGAPEEPPTAAGAPADHAGQDAGSRPAGLLAGSSTEAAR